MFFKKLHEDAMLPTVGTTKSAGHDLYVYDDEVVVPALETAVIHTGVKFSEWFNNMRAISPELPRNVSFSPFSKIEINIEPRSGLAAKHDLDAEEAGQEEVSKKYIKRPVHKRMAGICDQDYTMEIMVLIHNLHPTKEFTFKKGDKCAQMIFNVGLVDLDCVQDVERDGGFGSTGS